MKNSSRLQRSIAVTLATLVLHAAPTWAQPDTSAPTLDALDLKVRLLERKLEVAEEIAAAKTPQPVTTADGDGFTVKSADGNFIVKTRGLIQADYRHFLNDTNYIDVQKSTNADTQYTDGDYLRQFPRLTNSFLLRKVRPIWEATLWKYYNFRIMPDFSGGTTVLLDAYGEVNYWPALKLRAGKFKPPIGLERLQSPEYNNFVEFNFPASFGPNRDIGVQISGDLFSETVNYSVGYFNGAVDGGNQDAENTKDKDIAGRIFILPFKTLGIDLFGDFGVGIAGTWGAQWGDSVTSNLPSYRTSGQNAFFSYRQNKATGVIGAAGTIPIAAGTVIDSNSVRAAGKHTRFNPQAYWYAGPFSLLGEYITSTQTVARSKPLRDTTTGVKTFIPRDVGELTNKAWGVSASWAITGELASYKGVKPRHALGPGSGIGAIELVARGGQLTLDEKTFPLYADTLASARKATSYGGGVNWYFNKAVKWVVDFELTTFEQGAKDAAGKVKNRDDEQVVTSRLQVNF